MEIKMKTEKQDNVINDNDLSRAETLADLPVTDEQARDAKGGGDDMPTEEVSFSFGQVRSQYKP
jgi:hypothetical protein